MCTIYTHTLTHAHCRSSFHSSLLFQRLDSFPGHMGRFSSQINNPFRIIPNWCEIVSHSIWCATFGFRTTLPPPPPHLPAWMPAASSVWHEHSISCGKSMPPGIHGSRQSECVLSAPFGQCVSECKPLSHPVEALFEISTTACAFAP